MAGNDPYAFWFDRLREVAEVRATIRALVEFAAESPPNESVMWDALLPPKSRATLIEAVEALDAFDALCRELLAGADEQKDA